MRELCDDLRENVPAILERWERLVREEPWFSLPREHRIDNLPGVVLGLVDAGLCSPGNPESHRTKVVHAAEHGYNRREQGIPETVIFTEFHLLRQALWYHLVERHGASDRVVDAIMRIDTAITTATNASMWGYYRPEVESLGKWEESMERLIAAAPHLHDHSPFFRDGVNG